MITQEEVCRIGKLGKPHGVRGELLFAFTDDVFDRGECDYLVCMMEGILVPFYVESCRVRSASTALVKFEGIDTAEQARRMTNVEVYYPLALAGEEVKEDYSWHYFTGFRVEDVRSGCLGEIREVDDSTLNVLLVIDHDGEELLIPAQEEWVVKVDARRRVLYMQLPDGLVEDDRPTVKMNEERESAKG